MLDDGEAPHIQMWPQRAAMGIHHALAGAVETQAVIFALNRAVDNRAAAEWRKAVRRCGSAPCVRGMSSSHARACVEVTPSCQNGAGRGGKSSSQWGRDSGGWGWRRQSRPDPEPPHATPSPRGEGVFRSARQSSSVIAQTCARGGGPFITFVDWRRRVLHSVGKGGAGEGR